ncbi:MAG: site-specific integrase [Pseudonocardia sp.]|nr:site-specific integrase [Pseudonocardia sp.]
MTSPDDNTNVAEPSLPVAGHESGPSGWAWPIDLSGCDRSAVTAVEVAALRALGSQLRRPPGYEPRSLAWQRVRRLVEPLDRARDALHMSREGAPGRRQRRAADDAIGVILWRCGQSETSFWDWPPETWATLIGPGTAGFGAPWPETIDTAARLYLVCYAYLLTGFVDFHRLTRLRGLALARRVFGPAQVAAAIEPVKKVLTGWGHQMDQQAGTGVDTTVSLMLLVNRSPRLADLDDAVVIALREHPAVKLKTRGESYSVHRALAELGYTSRPRQPHGVAPRRVEGDGSEWMRWVDRWRTTSTLTPPTLQGYYGVLAKADRWLAAEHPEVTGPDSWTRQTCASWVARVNRMTIGELIQRHDGLGKGRHGAPLSARTKVGHLNAVRTFLRDCQEWEWIPRRFDPARALAAPRSVLALIGPAPRIIADDVWAKLLWAGLNIEPDDLPANPGGLFYPITLIRALTLTWLFSGLRSDETIRLRVGCVRWQHDATPSPSDSHDVLADDAVCLLDVPVHKTGTAFTKPVDPILGRAIETWEAERRAQPPLLDRKTGERVQFLFAHRARPVGKTYLNHTIIPALCAKAGVPTADARGNITSHRARSTIASQLYNAKEPMTLFELQTWLNHRSPETTQHYAKITPNTLTRAYTDAGYFARNVRAIEVLVDRDAVTSGAAAAGEPWQYYDLGHGYCTYTFFEQCPHRMACARCDFYTPKASSKGQLLEAKTNLQQMLANIPLSEEEQAAIDDGHAALDQLLQRLVDTPTPAGATPREMGVPATATLLTITAVSHDSGPP